MKIDDMGLVGAADAGARTLLRRHPTVVFTSGRRGVAEQAHAMASNIIRNRKWIAQTYLAGDVLQHWIDTHPTADTQAEIAEGLAAIMANWTDAQRGQLSKHFSGHAFDVQPMVGNEGANVKATIRGLPGLSKFLEREGGLIRWHAQF